MSGTILGMRRYPTLCLLALLASNCTGNDGETSETQTTGQTTGQTQTNSSTDATADPSETSDTGTSNAECNVDSDCQRIANCCECSSIPADVEPEQCADDCLVDHCTATGLESLKSVCRLGVCEFDSPLDCSGAVACESLPPECEPGMVPSVSGDCWGPCVPFHYCADTSNCGNDCGDDWACVQSQSSNSPGCVPLPNGCDGSATCECFAPYWPQVCPGGCSGGGAQLLCEDGG